MMKSNVVVAVNRPVNRDMIQFFAWRYTFDPLDGDTSSSYYADGDWHEFDPGEEARPFLEIDGLTMNFFSTEIIEAVKNLTNVVKLSEPTAIKQLNETLARWSTANYVTLEK